MVLINKKIMSLSMLVMLSTALTSQAGEQTPNKVFSNEKTVKTLKHNKRAKKHTTAKKTMKSTS